MADDDAHGVADADSAEAHYRRVFESRAAAWSADRGLVTLLQALEAELPHAMGPACKALEPDAPRPWVPEDNSERKVGLAFRRASRFLHPDRTSVRDLSIRIEAEEYLKVLSAAFDSQETWEADRAPSEEPTAVHRNTSSNTDLRDNIFGGSGAVPNSPPHPPPPSARPPGGDAMRDEIFGAGTGAAAPPPQTREERTATAPGGQSLRDDIFGDMRPRGCAAS